MSRFAHLSLKDLRKAVKKAIDVVNDGDEDHDTFIDQVNKLADAAGELLKRVDVFTG